MGPVAPVPTPHVSVVMPLRDAGATVDDALRSILDQTFPHLEAVVVDDHSTDDTPARLARWRDRDPRVRVIVNPGRGLVDALNTGVDAARAPLVARMDGDDLAHPRRLELQAQFLAVRPEITVVGSLVESFPRGEVREGYRIYERWLNALTDPDAIAREIYVESPLAHPSATFRRDAVTAAGGYRDVGWPEDYDLWLRLHHRGHRLAKVPAVLHHWRDHPERHSRTHGRYAVERFLETKAHYLARGPLADHPAVVWGSGRIGRRLGRHLLREGATIEAFIDIDPEKIGRTRHGRPILAPDRLPGPGTHVVLAAVGSRNARELIRNRVTGRGYVEGVDFLATA